MAASRIRRAPWRARHASRSGATFSAPAALSSHRSRPPMSSTAHTNRLAHETSPYLLQHQHNPVDWWAWGREALAEAQRTNRPILLSIGYAACHWCHVMAHESFEDAATAAVMNEHFVPIKVDRATSADAAPLY